MLGENTRPTIFFAFLAIVARVIFYVSTPIWLDYFNPVNETASNHSNYFHYQNPLQVDNALQFQSSQNRTRHINVIFLVVGQWSFAFIIFGITLAGILIFSPGSVSDNDRRYPKRNFFMIGCSQGISSLMINFAISGKRTAPYLQAILSNFGIPIQFIMRFLVLRHKPTCVKTVCASAVVMAEFVSLVPTIFQLDSQSERHTEGGATGVGRVLWPLLMVSSMIPFTFANTIMEKSVKDNTERVNKSSAIHINTTETEDKHGTSSDAPDDNMSRVNLVYFLFWWTFFNSLTVISFFWLDLIPGFGTSSDIVEFLQTISFNAQCLVGGAGCGAAPVLLGWLNFTGNLLGALAFAGLMRFSEGASFVVIVLALRTPILFLFWSLFMEQPFTWHPHIATSTWLSVAAILVMFPAVIIYNTGLPKCLQCCWCREEQDDEAYLIINDEGDEEIYNYRTPLTRK